MKKIQKLLSIVLALILALSVLTLAGVNAAAYEQDSGSHYLLPTGETLATAARFALGETVYGALSGSEQRFYQFSNSAARDLTLTVNTDQAIKVTVSHKDGAAFTVNETTGSTCSADVSAATVIMLQSAPAGDYVIQIDGAGSKAEFSFRIWCEGLPELKCSINNKTLEMTSGDTVALTLSDLTVNDVNYYWEVVDDPATTDIDESKVATVTEKGVVSVGFPTSEIPLSQNMQITVHAVFYYSTDNTVETRTKSCLITVIAFIFPIEPYVTELTLHYNQTFTVKASTNVKNGTIVWRSSDDSIVSVDSQGVIQAHEKEGTATLTAAIKYNGEVLRIRREIKVTVDDVPYPIAITFGAKSYTLRPGLFDKETNCFITYSDDSIQYADGKNIKFTSSNESVAIVNTKGKIQAVAPGDATITATTTDGSNISATCNVTVNDGWSPPPPLWLLILQWIIYIFQPVIEFFQSLCHK